MVNGLSIGPNAVKVFVEEVQRPETFLWRPSAEFKYLADSIMSFVAWSTGRVVFDITTDAPTPKSPSSSFTPTEHEPCGNAATGSKSQHSPVIVSKTLLVAQSSPLRRSQVIISLARTYVRKKNLYIYHFLGTLYVSLACFKLQRNNPPEVSKVDQKCKLMDYTRKIGLLPKVNGLPTIQKHLFTLFLWDLML